MDYPAVWGTRIHRCRLRKGLSQRKMAPLVAEELGEPFSQQVLSEIEAGEYAPVDKRRIAIANVLGVNVYELFAYEDNRLDTDQGLRDAVPRDDDPPVVGSGSLSDPLGGGS
ncbi:XRE family transcriptional regulator [Egibacter rhizosphaerae]|uniref:XRE family transcriptional regulator n=1 Tax=Egibacter rhizosphaerae TaxID=1670831 RepID=A0A411YDR1_9ACTN|nr:helix-turn-helix transcriptional regulator [Egibacter rhizosphaerae]QBI19379.1 XRE family transcriptional regulator [Egibacter rhizosphaerae]